MSDSPKGLMRFLSHASHRVSHSVCVFENPNAHTSSAHSQSLLINTTNLVRENYAVCEERVKDQEFSKIYACFSQVRDLLIP